MEKLYSEAVERLVDYKNGDYDDWLFINWIERRYSPSIYPKIYQDGDQWCALVGDNLQEGTAGYGDTPQEAIDDLRDNLSKIDTP